MVYKLTLRTDEPNLVVEKLPSYKIRGEWPIIDDYLCELKKAHCHAVIHSQEELISGVF